MKLHNFKADETILDIGCGDGAISAELATIASKGTVLGIDSSSEMIAYAKQNFAIKYPNLHFQHLSAENLCETNQYSLITAFNSLYWVKYPAKIFQRIKSALYTHGKMLALLYPLESLYWQLFIEVLQTAKFHSFYDKSIFPHWITSKAYIQLAQENKFRILHAETFTETASYEDKLAFTNYVNGWLPCIFPDSEEILSEYLEQVTNLAWKYYSDGNGSVNIPYTKFHLYLENT